MIETDETEETNETTTTDATRPLPDGWRWVRLGDVIAEAQPGFASGERDSEGAVQLRMNNVSTRGSFVWDTYIRVPASEQTVAKYALKPNDILFNNTNSTELVGKSALFQEYGEPVVYSNHFTRLRTNPQLLEPEYLSFWLQMQWKLKVFEELCNRWIGQSAVKNDKLLALSIPLPPLPEQRRIAAILRERLAAVEQARASAAAQLAAAQALPAAYLRAVFESDEARAWPQRSIEDFARTSSGSTPSRTRRDYYENGTIPWVKTGELRDNLIKGTEEHVTEAAIRETSLTLLPPGTLLIAMYGQGQTRGRTGLLACAATTNQACLAILPNRDYFVSEYLQYWFQHNYHNLRDESEGRGGNQPNLNGDMIRNQQMQLPSTEQQQQIAAELRVQMVEADRLSTTLQAQLDAIAALPQALLRQAFAGEL